MPHPIEVLVDCHQNVGAGTNFILEPGACRASALITINAHVSIVLKGDDGRARGWTVELAAHTRARMERRLGRYEPRNNVTAESDGQDMVLNRTHEKSWQKEKVEMRQTNRSKTMGTPLFAGAIALVVAAFSYPAVGQGLPRTPPDAGNGQRIAGLMCASCHSVSPGSQSSAVVGVPSFAAIANHAGQSPERLAGAIIIPHPPMPTVALTNSEIRDVIAYIMTLRGEK